MRFRRSQEKEVDACRVTSLDRFIDNQVDESQKIDVRLANNFGKNAHYEELIKGRLRYLETAGLAIEASSWCVSVG